MRVRKRGLTSTASGAMKQLRKSPESNTAAGDGGVLQLARLIVRPLRNKDRLIDSHADARGGVNLTKEIAHRLGTGPDGIVANATGDRGLCATTAHHGHRQPRTVEAPPISRHVWITRRGVRSADIRLIRRHLWQHVILRLLMQSTLCP